MKNNELNPAFVAELAATVYDIKQPTERRIFEAKYKNILNFDNSSYISARTGGYIINKKHIMALLCTGKGQYQGHAFVAITGTANLYDALTDLNTGVKTGHTGFPVHQGFYYAFDSMLTDLSSFKQSLKGISVIHCVGHSLGGAIATLAADWLKKNGGVSTVKLYTFGSPRVGLASFASRCSSNLQTNNIYRVYHKTDPVPMVPTWPFYDVPYNNTGYLLNSPVSMPPWKYHFMEHYVASAKSAGTWSSMAQSRPQSHMDSAIEKWLKSDDIISLTASTLELLNAALVYVIKKVARLVTTAVVATASTTLTLLDRMAILLAKGIKLSSELSSWIFHLVKKMAAIIGIKIKEGMDLTVALIRSVFIRVYRRISDMIWQIGHQIS